MVSNDNEAARRQMFNRRSFEPRLKHVRVSYAVGHFAPLSAPNNLLVSYSRQIAVYNGPLLSS